MLLLLANELDLKRQASAPFFTVIVAYLMLGLAWRIPRRALVSKDGGSDRCVQVKELACQPGNPGSLCGSVKCCL